MGHDLEDLVRDWIEGPNSEAGVRFSYQAREHYPPAVMHWLTVYCAPPRTVGGDLVHDLYAHRGPVVREPDPDLYLHPTSQALQNWAISYRKAARSRDAACGAVRSFYRWLQTVPDEHGMPLVPVGTHKTLRLRDGRFARGEPGRTLLTGDQCRHLAQAADRYRGPHAERERAFVYLLLNHYLHGAHDSAHVLRPGQITAMRTTGRVTEQARTTWRVPQKNAATDATAPQHIHPDAVLAIEEYMPHRAAPARGADEQFLFTTRNGNPLDQKAAVRTVRKVAETHPLLAEHARGLSADAIAHSPAAEAPGET
ncbi:hypothetical protein [Streptomyces sp. NPDC087300]|uniref:hypothetical protein n=1 Tax=Streptomyces sp. NPDC087300 TaxID=3365780 RepID=UPI003815CE3A